MLHGVNALCKILIKKDQIKRVKIFEIMWRMTVNQTQYKGKLMASVNEVKFFLFLECGLERRLIR